MIETTIVAENLLNALEETVSRLRTVKPERAAARPSPDVWSAQEVLGHLLDSATNNHQRFIRAQQEDSLKFPGYAQDFWMNSQNYSESDWDELLELWYLYNRHLARVIRRIPADRLDTTCTIGNSKPVTLRFLVEDYLPHMQHHLEQIYKRSS